MSTLIIGDVHGDWNRLNRVLRKALQKCPQISRVIQLGDLCEDFNGMNYVPPKDITRTNLLPIWAIDGNHDNHDVLSKKGGWENKSFRYIKRGERFKHEEMSFLGLGGAYSIDRISRPNGTFYDGEKFTLADINIAKLGGQVDIILTHERPHSFGNPKDSYTPHSESAEQRLLLDDLISLGPKIWFHGHHHVLVDSTHHGIRCIGMPDITQPYIGILEGFECEIVRI